MEIKEIKTKGVYSGFVGRSVYNRIKHNKAKEISTSISDDEREHISSKKGGIIVFANSYTLPLETLESIFVKYGVNKWSVGGYFHGEYKTTDDSHWDERSLSLELIGVKAQILFNIANELCDIFKQSALVKEFSTGRLYICTK